MAHECECGYYKKEASSRQGLFNSRSTPGDALLSGANLQTRG
jgi:hypothetical protein